MCAIKQSGVTWLVTVAIPRTPFTCIFVLMLNVIQIVRWFVCVCVVSRSTIHLAFGVRSFARSFIRFARAMLCSLASIQLRVAIHSYIKK